MGEWGVKLTHITSTFNGRSTGSCIYLRLDLYMPHVSLLCFYAHRLYLTCDMDKSSLRYMHDPVLLSLKVEVICYYTRIFCVFVPIQFLKMLKPAAAFPTYVSIDILSCIQLAISCPYELLKKLKPAAAFATYVLIDTVCRIQPSFASE